MPTLNQILSYLLLGQKGGKNRIQIIDLLKERPYNLNQLTEILGVNYRTVKHHIDVLIKNEIVSSSKAGGYGEVYFLTPEMEQNMTLFNNILKKLPDNTKTPGFYRNIMEQTNAPIIITDLHGEVFFWNAAANKMFGYNEEEIIGQTLPLFLEEDTFSELRTKVSGGEEVDSYETRLSDMNGNILDVSLTMDIIKDENDEMMGISILVKDITAERTLRESEQKYRTLFESSPDTIYILNENGIIKDVNVNATVKFGYLKEELIDTPLPDIFSSSSKKIFQEKFPDLIREGSNQAAVEIICKDGTKIPIDCRALVVRDDEGNVDKIIVSERDIVICQDGTGAMIGCCPEDEE